MRRLERKQEGVGHLPTQIKTRQCGDHRLIGGGLEIAGGSDMDQKFADQYYNYTTGRIANLFGFQVFEYSDTPVYTTAGTKRAFGAAAATGDRNASVAFIAQNTFKAAGSTVAKRCNHSYSPAFNTWAKSAIALSGRLAEPKPPSDKADSKPNRAKRLA